MPTYEFKCSRCEKQFEISASINEKEKLSKCPQCGSQDVNQIYSVNIFIRGGKSTSGCTSSCKVCNPQTCGR